MGFVLAPNSGGTDDNVTVTVASGSASLPQEGVSGSITGLTITNDGFHLDSATLAETDSTKPFSAFGGKFTITDPSVSLTNFGYSISAGASFNSDLTLTATEIDFNPTTSVSIAATNLIATISFTTTNLGHFTFTAGTVKSTISVRSESSLTLTASNIAFDSSPAPNGYIAQFGTLTADVKAGSFNVTGSGQDFAIDANGDFVTQPGFGVSLDLTASSQIEWPSWLPIQIKNLGVTWPDFQTDPSDFTLDLSASIDTSIAGTSMKVSGSVDGAVIDVGLLEQGKFPITGLNGLSVSLSGQLFGVALTGTAFFDILDVDASGNPIVNDSTPVANRIFYGGIEGGISFAGAAGFEVRLGISSLGPLDAFLEVQTPILLDPENGLAVTDLYGEIEFDQTLTPLANASDLANDPDLTPPTTQTDAQWEKQLMGQVANQAAAAATGMNVLTQPITITAGATFYDEFATQNAFTLAANVKFDTTGKFLAFGTLTLGDEASIQAAMYVDLSQVAQGQATILLYAQAPVQAPILTFYGSLGFTIGGDLDLGGTDQYAMADGSGLSLDNSSFTVEFWAKRAKNGTAETVISQGTTTGFQAGFDASNDFVVTFGGSTLTYANTDENWHHWAVTFNKSTRTRTLFEDGQEVASDTTDAISGGGTALYIGQSGEGTSYFDGSVDVVRVWSAALTQSEIESNYQTDSVTTTQNLIGAWNFDTGPPLVSAPTSPDLSKNNQNPMAFYNGPTFGILPGSTAAPFVKDNGFEITVSGEVDVTAPLLPEKLSIIGSASFQVDITNINLDLSVTGSVDFDPLGQLATLAGNVDFADPDNSPELYGALVVESNLGAIPLFMKAGLTASNATIGVLQLNTTSVTQYTDLTLPGAAMPTSYALPPDAFSVYINGSIGLEDVFEIDGTLYASFSYAKLSNGSTDPELDIAFNDDLKIGPTSAPMLTFSAAGILMISSAGLAAQLTVTPEDSSTLGKEGIDFSGTSFTLDVNTTGANQSFTVPTILDPNGKVSPGSGQTYTVPGVPTIPGASPAAVSDPGSAGTPYLLVYGTADMTISGFDLAGSFDMLVTPNLFRIDITQMTLSVDVNHKTIFSFMAQGGLLLETSPTTGLPSGFAGAISVSLAPTSPTMPDFEIDASFTFEVNTTSVVQEIGGISIPGPTAMLTGTGDLEAGPSGSQFDIHGTLTITINPTGLALDVDGMAMLGALGNIAATGDLVITDLGLYGALTLSVSADPFPGFLLSGQFQIELNTTTASQTTASGVSIPDGTFELHISGRRGRPQRRPLDRQRLRPIGLLQPDREPGRVRSRRRRHPQFHGTRPGDRRRGRLDLSR